MPDAEPVATPGVRVRILSSPLREIWHVTVEEFLMEFALGDTPAAAASALTLGVMEEGSR